MRRIVNSTKKRLKEFLYSVIFVFAVPLVILFYGDIWKLRNTIISSSRRSTFKIRLYYSYLSHYGSWIGLGAKIKSKPVFPHNLYGIFISNKAIIGENVVIFHQVTIGSNTTKGSSNNGAPKIEDNVYIGCGAKLIGNITIGKNARIGANCICVKDVPTNSVAIMRGFTYIEKNEDLDNEFLSNNWL